MEIGGKTLTIKTGDVARQANGSVTIQCEDTTVLVTAVDKEQDEPLGFLPLTVNVEERMYAAGKIPGGFFKREGRPSEKSILTARLIDRPLRPSFPDGFYDQVQIIATILSVDQINPFDVLALNGASAALVISDIPFDKPIGAVRISRAQGRWIINPTFQEIEHGDMDLVVAGYKDAILMVEATVKEASEEDIVEAMGHAHEAIIKLVEFQERLKDKVNKTRKALSVFEVDPEVERSINELAETKLKKILSTTERSMRDEQLSELKKQLSEEITQKFEEKEYISQQFKEVFYNLQKKIVRTSILEKNQRLDGRKSDEIRSIGCEVGLLPRTHGSGLFNRGDTQVLSVVTLGTVSEEQRIDGIGIEESKRFLNHYNFPPFSTQEVAPMRGPRRRDIGHGALVEKALAAVIPEEKDFPYTIRLVSEVLESNGSTSMASVCASCLALMDAGVPIAKPVAGIAMGLIKEPEEQAILTDILGQEDALGDMDFKVAGTKDGITALQMDIKAKGGLEKELLKRALDQSKKARLIILDKMTQVLSGPREKISEFAPRIIIMQIDTDKIREVIGPGGKMIHSIIEETGVTIDIEDDGTVFIASEDEERGEKARKIVEDITKEIKVGEKYMATVVKIMPFGAFVEILPGRDGLVHISKLAKGHVKTVEDVVKVGDKILVEVIEIDKVGRINLAKEGI